MPLLPFTTTCFYLFNGYRRIFYNKVRIRLFLIADTTFFQDLFNGGNSIRNIVLSLYIQDFQQFIIRMLPHYF